jgi:predicted alpha/beta hydrolase family esterase
MSKITKVVILHGTGGSSSENWFPWLKATLESDGYQVWVPDLPGSERPVMSRYTEFLMQNAPWPLDEHTLFIGHSSGAAAILGLLQALPANAKIGAAILVGVFDEVLSSDPDWEMLRGLYVQPIDYEIIKHKAGRFICINSDNDPYVPLEQAKEVCAQIDGEMIIMPGKKHFSVATDPVFTEFPQILPIFKKVTE